MYIVKAGLEEGIGSEGKMAVTRALENIGIHSETTPRFGQEEIHEVNAGAVPTGYTPRKSIFKMKTVLSALGRRG